MKALKIIIRIAAALLVFALGIWLLQRLLVPKYVTENEEGLLVKEYYSYAGGNDVLFIGDCEVYSNFSPVRLWQDFGITSAIRGSPQQLIWHSYYMLEDTLRYETPKVVVFNVLSMKYGEPQSEAYNRLALDGMKWSDVKYRAIKASMTEEEADSEALTVASYVMPILRFHSRWNELTGADFKYMFGTRQLSHNGYVMRIDVKPVDTIPKAAPLPDYSFADVCWDYLEKIRTLCDRNGIQLILIKAPTLRPHWYDEWDEQIVKYAEEKGLCYVNILNEVETIGIDYTTDTFDAGMHLNLSGAEKLTKWFGTYLKANTALPNHRGEAEYEEKWIDRIDYYNEMAEAQAKQLSENGKLDGYWGD
ncbi:MAG: SGNH/GDSL hydrolase family protein [Clostridia bacterium]|nr:SGNH/GDSL hydrolase family protein [Clostridia bacterium]